MRTVLQTNEKLFTATFDNTKKVKTYSKEEAVASPRVNGMLGLRSALDSNWHLNVVRAAGDTLKLTIDDLKKLPKEEVIFNFKCIEGWSEITRWAGVPLKLFMDYYQLTPQSKLKYVGMHTPDNKYYVGIDMKSALQPQTILCYEMNGKPLPMNQGYPLRLIIPVKYGIKHLKRIGTIYFSNDPPPDYWAQKGYDYFAGF